MAKLYVGALAVRLALGLLLVLVPVLVIKFVVLDKVDEATSAAGFENIPASPTDISPGESLYKEANFQQALDALTEEAGGKPELLKVGVLPYMAEFQVKQGDSAVGYRYYAKNGDIGEFQVKIVGGGSIEGKQFAFSKLDPMITTKLERGVLEREAGAEVTNMNLEKGLTGDPLSWSINAETDSRTGLVYRAKPDGSGLADATTFARRQIGAPEAPSKPAGSIGAPGVDQAECIQKAGTDVAKIQACTP